MEIKEIKALLALMRENGLVELEIEDKRGKVRLVRAHDSAGSAPAATAAAVAPMPGRVKHVPVRPKSPNQVDTIGELPEDQKLVTSPMVGTFYRASSPGATPFVDEGDSIKKGQVLCIIEAMKMMNEIDAEFGGKVVKILCENGQPVEYGQPLMVVEVS